MSLYPSKADKNRRDAFEISGSSQRRIKDFFKLAGRLTATAGRASSGPQQMNTLETVIDKLFPFLMFFGLISPLVALLSAVLFYNRHRDRVEPERRVGGIAYFLAVIIGGVISAYVGVIFGIQLACSSPTSSNLCGLWGFFVTGPLLMALAVFLIGWSLSLVRPASKP
jgi:hypothetical protein